MKRICVIAGSSLSIKHFLAGHIRSLAQKNQVYIIPPEKIDMNFFGENVVSIILPMARKPKFWLDICTLYNFLLLIYRFKFNFVLSVSPKAGFIAMLASKIMLVKYRVHWFTGQVWVNDHGIKFHFFKFLDQITAKCCSSILVDSHSQNEFLIESGVIPKGKSTVIGQGSISGVDIHRFSPNKEVRARIRNSLGIKSDDCLFLYVGRLCQDKGVLDLAEAFKDVSSIEGKLLVVGPDEEKIWEKILKISDKKSQNIIRIDYVDHPELYMIASDALVLPSYREGFGLVVIEAAACGLPCIGTRIYGLSDAVEDCVTGALYDKGNISSLRGLLEMYIKDSSLRIKLGEQARARAISKFSNSSIEILFMKYINETLEV